MRGRVNDVTIKLRTDGVRRNLHLRTAFLPGARSVAIFGASSLRPPFYMPRYATLDDVFASYPDRFQPEKAKDVHAIVHMNLTGENARSVVLHVDDGALRIEDGATPEDPTLSLTADADDWLAIENGALNPMMAMMSGKLKLKGSIPFATKFMTLFGYGG